MASIVKIFNSADGKSVIGYGVMDSLDYKYVSKQDLVNMMQNNPGYLANAKIQGNNIVITNGAENKYPYQKQGSLTTVNSAVGIIIAKIDACKETGNKPLFILSNHCGESFVYESNALAIECYKGIVVNAKVTEQNDKYIISSINGTYEKVPLNTLGLFSTINNASFSDVARARQEINQQKETMRLHEINQRNTIVEVDIELAKEFTKRLYTKLSRYPKYNIETKNICPAILQNESINDKIPMIGISMFTELPNKPKPAFGLLFADGSGRRVARLNIMFISVKKVVKTDPSKDRLFNGIYINSKIDGVKMDEPGRLLKYKFNKFNDLAEYENEHQESKNNIDDMVNSVFDYLEIISVGTGIKTRDLSELNSSSDRLVSINNRQICPARIDKDKAEKTNNEVAAVFDGFLDFFGKFEEFTGMDKDDIKNSIKDIGITVPKALLCDLRLIVDDLNKYDKSVLSQAILYKNMHDLKDLGIPYERVVEILCTDYYTRESDGKIYLNVDGLIALPDYGRVFAIKRHVLRLPGSEIPDAVVKNDFSKDIFSPELDKKIKTWIDKMFRDIVEHPLSFIAKEINGCGDHIESVTDCNSLKQVPINEKEEKKSDSMIDMFKRFSKR